MAFPKGSNESSHPVLLGSGGCHVLALEFVGHADVKVPGILLVGTAFQNALNDFPLVNNQSVFQVEHSLLPVCVPRPATTIMLSTDLCLQEKCIHLLSVGHRCARI